MFALKQPKNLQGCFLRDRGSLRHALNATVIADIPNRVYARINRRRHPFCEQIGPSGHQHDFHPQIQTSLNGFPGAPADLFAGRKQCAV